MNSIELPPADCPYSIPWVVRIIISFVGLTLIGLLLTAAMLIPSENGFGTHQQLGLPPCTFSLLFEGMPCPSCGMTTSWSHMVRGELTRSFAANPGGALLALTAFLLGPWALISGLRGRWLIGVPSDWIGISVAILIFVVTLVNWGVRLMLWR